MRRSTNTSAIESNGLPRARAKKPAYGPDTGQEHRRRDESETTAFLSRLPLPHSPERVSWPSRHCFSASAQGDICARLFLAPAPQPSVQASQEAKVANGLLVAKIGAQCC